MRRFQTSSIARSRAKAMRRNMTDAERLLWHHLRAHRLQNLSFRRQVPMGPYIADFVCHRARLIIEIDGGQHATDIRDVRRDEWFAGQGYLVLRFRNNEVLGNLSAVLSRIAETASIATGTQRCGV